LAEEKGKKGEKNMAANVLEKVKIQVIETEVLDIQHDSIALAFDSETNKMTDEGYTVHVLRCYGKSIWDYPKTIEALGLGIEEDGTLERIVHPDFLEQEAASFANKIAEIYKVYFGF